MNLHSHLKLITFSLCICLATTGLRAQHVGFSFKGSLKKEIKLNKKWSFPLEQSVQINPEISSLQIDYDDLFEAINPIPAGLEVPEADNGSGGQTDTTGYQDPDAWIDPLADTPKDIRFSIQSSTELKVQYRLGKQWRLSGSYFLYYDPGRFRHSTELEARFFPKINSKKFRYHQRFTGIALASPKDDLWIWTYAARTRTQMDLAITEKHAIYHHSGLIAGFQSGKLVWDRMWSETGIKYTYEKMHEFSFGYRFQHRINRTSNANGHSIRLAYVVVF